MPVYQFRSRVLKIEKRERTVRAFKEGDDVRTEMEDLGWFVQLEGLIDSIKLSNKQPAGIHVGQTACIILEFEDR